MRALVLIALVGCGFRPSAEPANGADARPANGADAPLSEHDGTPGFDAALVDALVPDAPPVCVALPPSINVDASQDAAHFVTAPTWTCDGAGTTTIDSAAGTVMGTGCAPGTPDLSNSVPQLDASGPAVLVVRLAGLTVTNGHVLALVGDKPIVVLVAGDVLVDSGGMITASASGATPGPGGSLAGPCTPGSGGPAHDVGWGGGGGGFGTAGGQGGYNVINGGVANGNATLVPLRGGCAGGVGAGAAGGGGGAVEISAAGTITIGGTGAGNVVASGGGAPQATAQGGNGGGAGGGILLAAPGLPVLGSMGALRANGGSGSSSNNAGRDGHATDVIQATDTSGVAGGGNGNDHGRAGGMAYQIGAAAVVTLPGDMTTAQGGGRGGGGGGGGRIQLATGTTSQSCH